jgi:ATP-binding protein involved in chromosome partitioning
VTKEDILAKLKTVKGPDLEAISWISGWCRKSSSPTEKVYFSLTVPAARAQELEPLREAAERATKTVPGVKGAMVALTASREPGSGPSATAAPGAAASGPFACARAATGPCQDGVPGIKPSSPSPRARAVSASRPPRSTWRSGCRQLGLKVGILDADIYGPSMPRLLRINGRPSSSKAAC